ncbi:uncharacterized protein LOC133341989 isoform X2 [Lethenteron reissneri]|uniref:uncharacterized protein LOC133341989 isoform X2 n=1 Tax=Lethenteron reissneri TaxID=7753 RepID=UPI002AB78A98|nr:uncharacterized protein LOC133341989 isoform X2 [Lethenteron reissneri]
MNSTDYKERTLFVSNVDPQVTEGLLYELFLQAGPLCKVVIPKSKPGVRSLKAFVTFKHVESTPYALAMLHGILLFGKPLQLKFYRGNKFETQRRKILQNRSAILHGDEALSYSHPAAQLPVTTPARAARHPGTLPSAAAAAASSPLAVRCKQQAMQSREQGHTERQDPHHRRSAAELGSSNGSLRHNHSGSRSSRDEVGSVGDRIERDGFTGLEGGRKRDLRARLGPNRNHRQADSRCKGEDPSMEFGRYSGSPDGRDDTVFVDMSHGEDKRSWSSSCVWQHKSPKSNDWERRQEGNHPRGHDSKYPQGRSQRSYSPGIDSESRQGRSERDYSPSPYAKFRQGRSQRSYSPGIDSESRQGRSERDYSAGLDSACRQGRSERDYSPSPYAKYRQGRSERSYSPGIDSESRQGRSERGYSPSLGSECRLERSERDYSPSSDEKYLQGRPESVYSPHPDARYRVRKMDEAYFRSPEDPFRAQSLAVRLHSTHPDANLRREISQQVYSQNVEGTCRAAVQMSRMIPSRTEEMPSRSYSDHLEDSDKINLVSQNNLSRGNGRVNSQSHLTAISKRRNDERGPVYADGDDVTLYDRKRSSPVVFDQEDEYDIRRKIDAERWEAYHTDVVERSLEASCREGLNVPRRSESRYLTKRTAFKSARQYASDDGTSLKITTVFNSSY